MQSHHAMPYLQEEEGEPEPRNVWPANIHENQLMHNACKQEKQALSRSRDYDPSVSTTTPHSTRAHRMLCMQGVILQLMLQCGAQQWAPPELQIAAEPLSNGPLTAHCKGGKHPSDLPAPLLAVLAGWHWPALLHFAAHEPTIHDGFIHERTQHEAGVVVPALRPELAQRAGLHSKQRWGGVAWSWRVKDSWASACLYYAASATCLASAPPAHD